MKIINLTLPIFILLISNLSMADDDIAKIYQQNGINGTLIISSLDQTIEYVHNKKRSLNRFLPASTFKIPNTLIALKEKAIKDEKQTIKWDGTKKGMAVWDQDQTLTTAFKRSCVWCYQEFAEKIGNDKYLEYLNLLNYGTKKTGRDIRTFWLTGDLAISAKEQINFLIKLYKEELPFLTKDIRLLKKIMTASDTPNYSLKEKTGWTKDIGWYVGYVEVNTKVWFFASNIQVKSRADLALRKQLVLESLKVKGIINS